MGIALVLLIGIFKLFFGFLYKRKGKPILVIRKIAYVKVGWTNIIELCVQGNEEDLEKFKLYIKSCFDLTSENWEDTNSKLTLTFVEKASEGQTLNEIKKYTKWYVKIQQRATGNGNVRIMYICLINSWR